MPVHGREPMRTIQQRKQLYQERAERLEAMLRLYGAMSLGSITKRYERDYGQRITETELHEMIYLWDWPRQTVKVGRVNKFLLFPTPTPAPSPPISASNHASSASNHAPKDQDSWPMRRVPSQGNSVAGCGGAGVVVRGGNRAKNAGLRACR